MSELVPERRGERKGLTPPEESERDSQLGPKRQLGAKISWEDSRDLSRLEQRAGGLAEMHPFLEWGMLR